MFQQFDYEALHNNPDAYWCWGCGKWTFDCSHLVEPLTSPVLKLNYGIYSEVTWQNGVIQITPNTGERYQHFGVSRSAAIAFAKNPDNKELIKGKRLERVRGVAPIEW